MPILRGVGPAAPPERILLCWIGQSPLGALGVRVGLPVHDPNPFIVPAVTELVGEAV